MVVLNWTYRSKTDDSDNDKVDDLLTLHTPVHGYISCEKSVFCASKGSGYIFFKSNQSNLGGRGSLRHYVLSQLIINTIPLSKFLRSAKLNHDQHLPSFHTFIPIIIMLCKYVTRTMYNYSIDSISKILNLLILKTCSKLTSVKYHLSVLFHVKKQCWDIGV